MTPDTTPAAPTPTDYAAALALIDDLDGLCVGFASERVQRHAVFAVARAAVDKKLAYEDCVRKTAEAACYALDAAVADLIALAVGGAS